MTSYEVEALSLAHRHELARLQLQLARYRVLLEDNGIEPPEDIQTEEFLRVWRSYSTVMRAVGDFVAALGTSNEMLSESWLR